MIIYYGTLPRDARGYQPYLEWPRIRAEEFLYPLNLNKNMSVLPDKSVPADTQARANKSIPPDESVPADTEYEKWKKSFWMELKNVNKSTFSNANKVFEFSYLLGWIVAFLGVLLFIISIFDTFSPEGIKWENTIAGGIGVSALLAQFIWGPQNKVHRSLVDFVQVQMYYRTYEFISQAWNNWDNIKTSSKGNSEPYTLEELDKLIQILVENTMRLSSNLEISIGELENASIQVISFKLENDTPIHPEDEITIKVQAKNFGLKKGSKEIIVYLDDKPTDQKSEVTLDPGETKEIVFIIKTNEVKTHSIKVGNITKEFTVELKAISPDINVKELIISEIQDKPECRKLDVTFSNTLNEAKTNTFDVFINGEKMGYNWEISLKPNEEKNESREIPVIKGKNVVKIGDKEKEFSID